MLPIYLTAVQYPSPPQLSHSRHHSQRHVHSQQQPHSHELMHSLSHKRRIPKREHSLTWRNWQLSAKTKEKSPSSPEEAQFQSLLQKGTLKKKLGEDHHQIQINGSQIWSGKPKLWEIIIQSKANIGDDCLSGMRIQTTCEDLTV